MKKNIINQIKTLLSMEINLEQMKLEDGITIIEAEKFEPEYSVGIVTADGIVPMPVGEYTLEDGKMVVVAQEGIIAEVKDAASEEVAAPAEAEVTVEVEAEAKPKRVVESVSKETFFEEIEKLRAEFTAIKAENEELKAELSKIELSAEDEAGADAIAFNPEAKQSERITFGNQMQNTTQNRVFKKLFN
tara:strand:- start:3840 stop:4406 length:567 start_codon:yes stop_codon:yes gene_type:complete